LSLRRERVQVGVRASGQASITTPAPGGTFANTYSQAIFSVSPSAGGSAVISDSATLLNPTAAASKSFTDTNSYALTADTLYSVSLSLLLVGEISGNLGGGKETLSASLDPIFLVPHGYTLELNPNIGNMATQLPAALPLFATDLGAMGLFGWRRKWKVAALAA
jgi:hypothetical protein